MRLLAVAIVCLAAAVGSVAWVLATHGRYNLAGTATRVWRIDTTTGQVSLCDFEPMTGQEHPVCWKWSAPPAD